MASRTFVGFSSADITYFRLMLAWKANENMDFDFVNCQLAQEINSENEEYIKRKCRERIDMAGTFISLIGQDTHRKHKFVRWELDVALEKKCRIIAVNFDGGRKINADTCPPIINDVGAIFIPFSPRIVNYALENFERKEKGNWNYSDDLYRRLGY